VDDPPAAQGSDQAEIAAIIASRGVTVPGTMPHTRHRPDLAISRPEPTPEYWSRSASRTSAGDTRQLDDTIGTVTEQRRCAAALPTPRRWPGLPSQKMR